VLPGLGQLTQGRRRQALTYFAITLLLIALSLSLGRISGRAAAFFFFMLLALPWWAIQSYDAYLGPSDSSADLQRTWRAVWARAHDIRFLGALFLLSAINDSFIILMNPEYLLPFCTKPGAPRFPGESLVAGSAYDGGLWISPTSPMVTVCLSLVCYLRHDQRRGQPDVFWPRSSA
jgi:hypothetical protein